MVIYLIIVVIYLIIVLNMSPNILLEVFGVTKKDIIYNKDLVSAEEFYRSKERGMILKNKTVLFIDASEIKDFERYVWLPMGNMSNILNPLFNRDSNELGLSKNGESHVIIGFILNVKNPLTRIILINKNSSKYRIEPYNVGMIVNSPLENSIYTDLRDINKENMYTNIVHEAILRHNDKFKVLIGKLNREQVYFEHETDTETLHRKLSYYMVPLEDNKISEIANMLLSKGYCSAEEINGSNLISVSNMGNIDNEEQLMYEWYKEIFKSNKNMEVYYRYNGE